MIGRIAGVAALAFLGTATAALAGEVTLAVAGMRATVDVQSMEERQWINVVQQEHDFSCGAAAVATVLTYHYGIPTTEAEVFNAMFAIGDQQLIQEQGFSMLDLKNYVDSIGFGSNGYRITLDQLRGQGVPAIVLLRIRGYLHFVVIQGITDTEVLVGDPAFGHQRYSIERFQELVASDVFFVIVTHASVGRENFNPPEAWSALPRAPIGPVGSGAPGSAAQSLSLPIPFGITGATFP